jgi:hypothetical protein
MARADGDIVITVGGDVGPLTNAVTKAERTLGRLNSATATADRQFRAMVGTTSEVQSRINALTGFTERLGKSAEKSAGAFEMFDRSKQAVDRLRASYDPLFAASKRYESAVEQLDDALQMGVITQAQYATMAQKLGASMLTAEGQAIRAGQGVGKFGLIANQLGYQIQDVFVSAPMIGWFRAIAQQAPQAAGAFSMLGGSLGAVVPWIGTGIAVGAALIPTLFDMGEGAETAADSIDRLEGAVNDYSAAVAAASAPMAEMVEKYGRLAASAQTFLDAMAAAERVKAAEAIAATISAMTEGLLNMRQFADDGTESWHLLSEALGVSEQSADRLANLFKNLATAKGPEEQAKWARIIAEALDDAAGGYANMNGKAREVYDTTIQIAGKISEVVALTDRWPAILQAATAAAKAAAAAVDSIGNAASGAYGAVSKLVDKMMDMARAKALANDILGQMAIEFSPGGQAALKYGGRGESQDQADLAKKYDKFGNLIPTKTGGGGGGGKKDDTADRLEKLRDDFLTETEELRTLYEDRNAVIDEGLAKGLLTEQEYNDLRLQAQADFNAKMRALDQAALQDKLSAWSGAFGDLSSLMNTENKKLFRIGQAAAIAQAVVDGWASAVSAWEKGMKIGGPPVAAAFTAMSLAKTGAMIASIKSASMNGGGGGGSVGGGSAGAAPALPIQRVDIALTGGSADTMTTVEAVIAQLNEAASRGYRIDARLVAA